MAGGGALAVVILLQAIKAAALTLSISRAANALTQCTRTSSDISTRISFRNTRAYLFVLFLIVK